MFLDNIRPLPDTFREIFHLLSKGYIPTPKNMRNYISIYKDSTPGCFRLIQEYANYT